jgi:hypothetical protein
MIACAQCGTAMPTPTGRAARKRYCNVECRKAAWRQRHRDDTAPAGVVRHVVPGVPGVPGVPAVPTALPDDVPTRGGQHHCPHCRQPLAIISVLIPAEAAVVQPPEVSQTAYNSANLNPSPGEDDLANLGNFDERQQRPPRPRPRPRHSCGNLRWCRTVVPTAVPTALRESAPH